MVLGESLATQTLLLDTHPLPCSFVKFYVDWKFLIIALMVEMGTFTALALFLKPLNHFFKLNYLLLHIRNIFSVFVFFIFVMDD